MEVVLKDSIFSDLTLLDDAYFNFMQANRSDLATIISTQSMKFCYNFSKDEAFSRDEQTTIAWESEMGKTIEEPGFVFAGRTSIASLDTMATFPTSELDGELEIPEINFAKMGRTSLANEEFANELGLHVQEDDLEEGTVSHVPCFQGTKHVPASLPFGRQV